MKKRFALIYCAAIYMLISVFPAYAEEWKQNEQGWWYECDDGSYLANSWKQINGKWYFFNNNGYMATGWIQTKGIWYYLGSDGAMLTNTVTPDGYFVDSSGAWINTAVTAPSKAITDQYNDGKHGLELGDANRNDGYATAGAVQVIDRGSYYELTNCSFSIFDILSKDYVESKEIGDKVKYEGDTYRIADIGYDEYDNRKYYYFKEDGYVSYVSHLREYENGYLAIGSSDYIHRERIYTGSVYMAKNCKISIGGASGFGGQDPITTPEDYLFTVRTSDQSDGYLYGNEIEWDGRIHISLCGRIVTDSSGVIVEYIEVFYP